MAESPRDIVIIGGPNGAGKTTAAKELLLPRSLPFTNYVNADDIARNLSPRAPERAAIAAGRVMIKTMTDLLEQRTSFAFETTCSGLSHVAFLRRARAEGYRISLLFLWLPSPEYAIRRVALRVREGGHFIPDHIVTRRYRNGIARLRSHYLSLADVAAIYDNSDEGRRLVAERTPDRPLVVHDSVVWAKIEDIGA